MSRFTELIRHRKENKHLIILANKTAFILFKSLFYKKNNNGSITKHEQIIVELNFFIYCIIWGDEGEYKFI